MCLGFTLLIKAELPTADWLKVFAMITYLASKEILMQVAVGRVGAYIVG